MKHKEGRNKSTPQNVMFRDLLGNGNVIAELFRVSICFTVFSCVAGFGQEGAVFWCFVSIIVLAFDLNLSYGA